MNEIQIFNHADFGQIRTVSIDGDPWFVGRDVAISLGYGDGKSPANAVAKHIDADDKGVTEMMTPGGIQNVTIINESGLYSLILSSKLPSAKKFKHWVTSEVLPSIRRTGMYTAGSKELQAIFMLDSRTVQHEQRIAALEDSMVVDYGQQRALADQVNMVVVAALGGRDSAAYADRSLRSKLYSECNRDLQRWFRVNSRNNIPRKRFDEAVEYIQRWRPSTNTAIEIQQSNGQTSLYGYAIS